MYVLYICTTLYCVYQNEGGTPSRVLCSWERPPGASVFTTCPFHFCHVSACFWIMLWQRSMFPTSIFVTHNTQHTTRNTQQVQLITKRGWLTCKRHQINVPKYPLRKHSANPFVGQGLTHTHTHTHTHTWWISNVNSPNVISKTGL